MKIKMLSSSYQVVLFHALSYVATWTKIEALFDRTEIKQCLMSTLFSLS